MELKQQYKDIIAARLDQFYTDTDFTILNQMKDILNKVYGKENNQVLKPDMASVLCELKKDGWDVEDINIAHEENMVDTLKRTNLFYNIIILFPEVTIVNSHNSRHTIKELYVKFSINPDGKLNSYLQGVRGAVTLEEYASSYFHSHLRGFTPQSIDFENFCLGEGPIHQVAALLKTQYDEINFELFLQHIKSVVAYESLEGNPFKKLEEIGTGQNLVPQISLQSTYDLVSEFERYIFSQPEEIIKSLLQVSLLPSYIKVSGTPPLNDFLVTAVQGSLEQEIKNIMILYERNNILCKKAETGLYVSLEEYDSSDGANYTKDPLFKFKGNNIYFKILDNEQKEQRTETIYINPCLYKELVQRLSTRFTKTYIREKRIKDSGASLYNTTASEPDLLAV